MSPAQWPAKLFRRRDPTARDHRRGELESGYGIFSGADTREAVLRFSPQLARWVSRETWHPEQRSEYDDDGYYLLRVPYSQDTELVMDILKHGTEVEVLEPPELRSKVRQRIDAMRDLYTNC